MSDPVITTIEVDVSRVHGWLQKLAELPIKLGLDVYSDLNAHAGERFAQAQAQAKAKAEADAAAAKAAEAGPVEGSGAPAQPTAA